MLDKIIIAGGGIAGLSVALGLARAGFSTIVYEKSVNLQEMGAGIQLGPNATRILQRWGVLENITPHAFAPDFICLNCGGTGKNLVALPIAHFVTNHWHAPYLTVHRADLQKILLQAVLRHPLIALHCGHEVKEISGNLSTGFEVEIDHKGQISKQKAGLFVACDGVWSRARANLPLQEKACNSGFVAWRATCAKAYLPLNFLTLEKHENVHAFMGKNGHFIAYPIRGGREFNFVAITKTVGIGQRSPVAHFGGWKPLVQDMLACVEDWTYWPLFTMQHPRFIGSHGEIFLGDSAHATTPFAAQGAALAIEDGAALVHALCLENMTLGKALQLFSQQRLKRVHAVNKRGNFNQYVYHMGFPFSFFRNILMNYRDPKKFLNDLNWLYNASLPL